MNASSALGLATPGSGARITTAVTQLYFRLCHYHPLTILVVDALCLTFGGGGASLSQLVDYLGVSERKVAVALEAIPAEMRCSESSAELSDEPSNNDTEQQLGKGGVPIYRLNFKKILPLAYAHVSRILLSLTAVPLNEGKEDVVLSPTLKLKARDDSEGIRCGCCHVHHHLSEFEPNPSSASSLYPCPSCGFDVLGGCLSAIHLAYGRARQLLVAPRGPEGGAASPTVTTSPSSPSPAASTTDALSNLLPECPLARDPLLVQQSLIFFDLFKVRLACLSDDVTVTSVEDILTEPEFHRRRRGGASSVAEQFRAIHRTVNAIHVDMASLETATVRKEGDNSKRIKKRLLHPPWLSSSGPYAATTAPTHSGSPILDPDFHTTGPRGIPVGEVLSGSEEEFDEVDFPVLQLRRLD